MRWTLEIRSIFNDDDDLNFFLIFFICCPMQMYSKKKKGLVLKIVLLVVCLFACLTNFFLIFIIIIILVVHHYHHISSQNKHGQTCTIWKKNLRPTTTTERNMSQSSHQILFNTHKWFVFRSLAMMMMIVMILGCVCD